MKLVHTSLNTAVLSDKYVFTEWIIESPKLYATYLQELFSQQNGEDGGFVLSDKEKELNLAKKHGNNCESVSDRNKWTEDIK